MNELINKLNEYRSMGDRFYPEDIVVTEDIWALIDEIERLNNIIDKAVEYIEYMQNISKNKNIYVSVYDLVKLLKGEDKE